uniref:Uncharacterized protein n=1 Tax=Anopheles culicifacies TaxID=139723 RepID=A0A182MMB5_9DIPT
MFPTIDLDLFTSDPVILCERSRVTLSPETFVRTLSQRGAGLSEWYQPYATPALGWRTWGEANLIGYLINDVALLVYILRRLSSTILKRIKGSLVVWNRPLLEEGTREKNRDASARSDGTRGHLEGLASVYCEMLLAPFGEVLAALEEARQRAWSERSPHSSSGGGGGGGLIRGHRGNSCHGGLPNSHSQPIYVPGKYSPSSCLSDKEEDEIYGFGYGVFAPRVARTTLQSQQAQQGQQQPQPQQQQQPQQQPQPQQSQNSANVPANSAAVQQSCLSPRSAYFYEFPPTGLGQELQAGAVPTRGVVFESQNERLRHFQMNGGGPQPSFEETIQRLKIQEALRKKEKFQREHEEVSPYC